MKLTSKGLIFILLSGFLTTVCAHDFWLNPNAYHTKSAPAQLPVKFSVGHKGDVDSWALDWNRIVALRTYHAGGFEDQLENIIINRGPISGLANVKLTSEGTHILAFESYHSFSSLDAERFNDYASKEGLDLIISDRKKFGQVDKDGREIYSRKAKTLLQVGNLHTDNVTSPVGLMLEIVPMVNPYALKGESELPIKVFFRGKVLENALIDIVPLNDRAFTKQSIRTNKQGEASFNIDASGSWMITVVWGVPNTKNSRAEYETYFSSLTFGYK
ncbi:DUF4198 domain-containing protein [Glaciecola sp. KUL10]|uniref:DUF4198 domain-containing protein n=1 Tax=Glaciecola sp. (strain KUL10) TaxID=2161813 RepID=UPI000D78ADEA|nr:DUF4198 domain-containing protein [Glaciecola sp. KUL10]GBL04958.1 hypothetical protein KUL10_22760 [Glaciecola sp. KUL10]